MRHGTVRVPGPDLRRMPIGLDFSGISLAEGLRAAFATGIVLLINIWVGSPMLTIAAFAANLTCFCDIGGPVRSRVPALLVFAVSGAALWSLLGLIHDAGWPVLIFSSGLVVFCNSMARVWGARTQAVGNILTVVLALAVDRTLHWSEALTVFGAFVAGGAWAILLTIGLWRIHRDRPAARMVATIWRLLADLARDLGELVAADETNAARWEAHARGHRRAVRDALEECGNLLVSTVRSPGPVRRHGARSLLGLQAAEQIFGALIALSDVLEASTDPDVRAVGLRVVRRLRPALVLLGQEVDGVSDRVEASLERMAKDGSEAPALSAIVDALIDRLRLAFGLKRERGSLDLPPQGSARPARAALRLQQLRSNLTWDSAILRHATRAAVLTMAAVAVTLRWWSPYVHWLTITVALTMQPYFAATWQRALERVGGTVLGGAIGGGLAFIPSTPVNNAAMLIPLCVIGFSVRQVSYGAYIACLTPLTVLLFEVAEPGHAEWLIAAWRIFYTISGGVIAVLACMVLWPSWEPDRTEGELRAALKAHAGYAKAVFDFMSGQGDASGLDEARRWAGVASNNLEASLSRALQEPGSRRSRRIESLLAADAALRRLGGGFLALRYDPNARDRVDEDLWGSWRAWIPAALQGLAERGARPERMPAAPPNSTLARLGRALELLGDLVVHLPGAENVGGTVDEQRLTSTKEPAATRPG